MNTKKKLIAQLMILIIALGGVLLMSLKPSVLFGKSLTTRAGVVSGIEKAVEERNIADPHDPIVKDLKAYTYIAKFQLAVVPLWQSFKTLIKLTKVICCGSVEFRLSSFLMFWPIAMKHYNIQARTPGG